MGLDKFIHTQILLSNLLLYQIWCLCEGNLTESSKNNMKNNIVITGKERG